MSHQATNWAFRQRNLKPATKIVLLNLADRHNPDFGCFPSLNRLMDDCEMSKPTLIKHLHELQLLGLIKIVERFKNDGSKTSNLYELNFGEGSKETLPPPSKEILPPVVKKLYPKEVSNNQVSFLKKKINKKRICEDAILSDKQREIALSKNVSEAEAKLQFEKFKDYSLANGKAYADWDAAWRNWLSSEFFKPIAPKLTSTSSTKIADDFLENLKNKKIRA